MARLKPRPFKTAPQQRFFSKLRHPSTSFRAGFKAAPFQNNAATEVFQQAAAPFDFVQGRLQSRALSKPDLCNQFYFALVTFVDFEDFVDFFELFEEEEEEEEEEPEPELPPPDLPEAFGP